MPSKKYAAEADYFGMVSGKTVDKFKATGLTAEKAQHVHAPYVKEFSMVLECRVTHTLEIGLHTQFIGEILDVKVDESVMGADDLPDMLLLDPFLYSAETRKYYGIGGYMGRAYDIGKAIS